MFPSDAITFKCKGCGAPAFYFPSGNGPDIPPGSVAHSKPKTLLRQAHEPLNAPCALWHRLEPAEFWEVHQDAERLAAPTEFKKVEG